MTLSAGNTNDTNSIAPNTVLIGDDPSWVPDRWRSELFPLWRKTKDVYDGFHLDRIKRRYLLQAAGESSYEFHNRLQGSYLDEHFRITLEKNAGLVAQFDVEPDSPEDMLDPELTKNVDAMGNSLQAFAQKSLARIFRDEFCLLGVSIAEAGSPEAQRGERKPFYTLTDARDVRAPLVQYVDDNGQLSRSGKLALTRISIRRWIQIPTGGFSYEWRQEFWVYRLRAEGCTIQIYQGGAGRDIDGDTGVDRDEVLESEMSFPVTAEELILDAAGRPLRQIPFYWYHLDKDASVGNPGNPPLLYLAETLIMWYNKESQLDAAERRCNLPTPAMAHPGGVPENPPDVRLGPEGVVHYEAGGNFHFVEPSGTALGSTHQRQMHREQRMERIDERFVGAISAGNLTATAVTIADKISKITMNVIAEGLETAFAELFKLYALFTDPTYDPGDSAGGIRVSRSVLEGDLQSNEVAVLLSLLQEGAIDRFELRAMLKLQTIQINDDVIMLSERMREEFEEQLENELGNNALVTPQAIPSDVSGPVANTSQIPGQPTPGSQQALQQLIANASPPPQVAATTNSAPPT